VNEDLVEDERMAADRARAIEKICRLFAERGDSAYGGEAVSQREHALQAAHFARRSGATAALITAALLHDVGHLLHQLPEDAPDEGVDDLHEELAARWLARWFGPEVIEPVRMHVDAKRYLCAVEPDYRQQLSAASLVSLALQGGPMTSEAVEAFRESSHADGAVALRRWDDAAKDPTLSVAGLDEYIPAIEEALATAAAAARRAP
jgi:[1-hydroxy-2-(trimethylamino)ethyl]phosphonate dioxygenase